MLTCLRREFHPSNISFAAPHTGWHHVEVHNHDWWQMKMEAAGFVYSKILTDEMKGKARQDSSRTDLVDDMITKNKTSYNVAQHLWTTLQVRTCHRFATCGN